MKKKKTKSNYAELRSIVEQQAVGFRKKAESLMKRELRLLRDRFATTSDLSHAVRKLEESDADQLKILHDFMGLVDKRFDKLEN